MKELKLQLIFVFFNLCLKNGIKKKKEMDESCWFSNGREEENEVEDSRGVLDFGDKKQHSKQ